MEGKVSDFLEMVRNCAVACPTLFNWEDIQGGYTRDQTFRMAFNELSVSRILCPTVCPV